MTPGPLARTVATVGDTPALATTGRLLAALGAEVTSGPEDRVTLAGAAPAVAPTTAEEDWARTGFAVPETANLRPTGAPATMAQASAVAVELLSEWCGNPIQVDGPKILGRRAALLDLPPAGRSSAGGSASLVDAADGWFALNLARPNDVELVPALIEADIDGDEWAAVRSWAVDRPLLEIETRLRLLGLAGGVLRYPLDAPAPWRVRRLPSDTQPSRRGRPGLVVNLGSLWAAPLCAQLLRRGGHRIVDVESPNRPDGARQGTPTFYAELHEGHTLVVLDLTTDAGRGELRGLVRDADVVITGSRAAAVARLGVTPPARTVRDQIWVTITGHGFDSERIGFGDDAAIVGGLASWTEVNEPRFTGDAIADPLTGLAAAAATYAALAAGGSWRIDIALRDIAACAARLPDVRRC